MIQIDGSLGEGGGQVLRTALALALVSGQPFRLEKIRAGRAKPGLLRQHLTAVQAAARIGAARVEGAVLGSTSLVFEPGAIRPGNYHFDIGTAGSTTLVLQTILPPLLAAGGPSRLTLVGGTHNGLAPPFDFLARTFLPLLNRLGPAVAATLERPGFFPAGGGRLTAEIQPAPRLSPLCLGERGALRQQWARVLIAGLPPAIAGRECQVLRQRLGWPEECCRIEVLNPAWGPGNIVLAGLEFEHVTEVFSAVGERGVKAEAVAGKAAAAALDYLAAGAPVGEHLADQLLLPLALAGSGSFRTGPLSSHFTTNLETIRRFLPVAIRTEATGAGQVLVSAGPLT